ncbi:MAG: FG-GAP repeat domain-containing protein [Myxococcota bacterium]
MTARMLALAAVTVVALSPLTACGGGGDGGNGFGDFGPPPDSGDPEDLGEDPGEDAVDDASDVEPGEPVVELLEIRGSRVVAQAGSNGPSLFCGREMTVLAGAEYIGDRTLGLVVDGTYVLPAEAEPDVEDGRWIFTVDPAALLMPEEGEPAEDSPNLQDGDQLTLTLAAFAEGAGGELALPNDEALFDEWTLTVDTTAPELTVTQPSHATGVPTLTGRAPIRGTVEDDHRVGHVEVWFNGDPVSDIPAAPEEATEQVIDGEIDLRGETTAVAPLEVMAYDACGYEAAWESEEAKVIAWPWLRTLRRIRFPGEASRIVTDSQIVDWSGDGYPDLVFATLDGLWVVLNEGAAAPGEFRDFERLTDQQTQQVAIVDLDADGDLDLVTIENLGSAGDGLVVYRSMSAEDGGGLRRAEEHPLEIQSSSAIRDLIVRDFTDDPPDLARDDVVVITSGQEESLLLFKRQNADAPQDFDQCQPREVPVGPDGAALLDTSVDAYVPDVEGDADAEVQTTVAQVCPTLFAPPVKAGGVPDIVHVEARDVTGNEGVPDGFPDLLVGSEDLNQVNVFSNRFAEVGIKDTTFSQSTTNYVWPIPDANQNDVQHFCTGNFIELPGEDPDPVDMVAGTAQSGTWRVLRGIGNGQFMNHTSPDDTGFPYDVWNMSGTVSENITGMVCADFNDDGHEDFAVLSGRAQMMQVHLGDGKGRFNQLSMAGSGVSCDGGQDCPDGEECMLTSCDAQSATCQRPCASDPECVGDNPRGPERGPCVAPSVQSCMQSLPAGQQVSDRYCGVEPHINPVNEGIGFVLDAQPRNPRVGDFDQDGLPDLLVDYRGEGFGILMNRTDVGDPDNPADNVFDMEATRALVSPLGKQGSSTGGLLTSMAVADLTGDGKAEVVGLSDTRSFPSAPWLRDYHPFGARYRTWYQCSEAMGCENWEKGATSPTVFVWSQGSYGPDMPSYPAAYDRMPRNIFSAAGFAGPVRAESIRVADLQGPDGGGADGLQDLIVIGGSAGNPSSNIALYLQAAPSEGFWHLPGLTQDAGAMFRPWNGFEATPSTVRDFVMMNARDEQVPGLFVATDTTFSAQCGTIPPIIRFCAWDPGKECQPGNENSSICPFWRCWEPSSQTECSKTLSLGVGGTVVDMKKLAIEGEHAGEVTEDPDVLGDLLAVSRATGSMSSFRWEGMDANPPAGDDTIADVFPFSPPSEKAVGENPRDMAVRDLDGDTRVDLASTVNQNVMVAFGQEGFHPFQSPLPVDSEQQDGGPEGVAMTDVNADGFVDVVFTEQSRSRVTAYLAAGLDANNEYLRQFHGPVHIPTCSRPTDITTHDFDGDGCEAIVVLCEGAGAIAIIENDSCTEAAGN